MIEVSKYHDELNIYAILKEDAYFCEFNDCCFENLFQKGIIDYDYIKNNFKTLDHRPILFKSKKEAQRFLNYLESLLVMEKLIEV